jgi:RimJ/RimL family protein N-acetyltransferase
MIDFGYGVTLNALRGDNLNVYLNCRNHPDIRKWCRQYDVISMRDHIKWYESLDGRKDVSMYELVNYSGTFVGVCGLTSIDRVNSRAEFSLYIKPDQQRKGYAKAGIKTLFSHGFLSHNLNVIWGETFEGNPALKMFLDLGMALEGTRHEFYYRDGHYIDCSLVSLSKREFKDYEKDWKSDNKIRLQKVER